MANALTPIGVIAGALVAAQGSPDMTVAVAAGSVIFDNTTAVVAAGNVTITTADATQDRMDAVVADSSGTKSVIAGTVEDGVDAAPPDTTAYALLAHVYVYSQAHPAYSGTITDAEIDTSVQTPAGVPIVGQIWLSSAGMWPSTTAGCADNFEYETATNKQNVYTLDFTGTGTDENAECSLLMPSDYDGGTITAQFVFFVNATSGGVVFQLQGRSYGDSETLDQAWGTAQKIAKTVSGTANQVLITDATPAITLAGTPAASEFVAFRVTRLHADASDTVSADGRLLGIMVNFTRL